MRRIALIGLVAMVQVQFASACSFDDLKKVGDERLEHLWPGRQQDFAEPSGEPQGDSSWNTWQVFRGEQGHPHTLVATHATIHTLDVIRISFVNRHDYVVISSLSQDGDTIPEEYNQGKRYLLSESPSAMYFCDDKPQTPPAGTPPPVGTKFDEAAVADRDALFALPEFKPYIAAVPE